MEPLTPIDPPIVGLTLEAPPQEVRRATVAFRIILAIPHLLFSAVLGFVAMVVAVIGWFAALFTGRLPDGIADFLGGIVQYSTRVYGYLYLLTDVYPPFSLQAGEYPISVALPPRGTLNRGAVLVRVVLAIPAMIATSVVGSGLQAALVVIWLILVVSGRRPTPVFEACSAVLRYQLRFYAWFLMLTSEYPRGLFGDPPLATAATAPTAPAAPVESPLEYLASQEGSRFAAPIPPPPPAPGVIPPPPPPPGFGAQAPVAPRITALILSRSGRRLVITFIVLGVVLSVGQIVASIVLGEQSEEALRELDAEYEDLYAASVDYGATIPSCAVEGGADCVAGANADFAAAVRELEIDVAALDLPSGALDEADQLRDEARALADLLDQMAAASSDSGTYERLYPSFQAALDAVDDAYEDLRDAVIFGV